ncbi:virulence associated protein [Synechococcus phage S-E7]|jgi:predicted RNase H-like nuclease (RuvC/YqgF family)|uniref:Uncharacterized protein n=2 Tax=Leucotheavirus TaxID=2733109 RepID=M4SIZ4_9CAUD|nr:hypothetical protein CPRG_00204 [Synechococcus phage Syn30]YP_009816019.1 virulence associated protein [Synechococcus phage S-P4]AGH56287.1 hypothetical protein CPRG_00204 [Synechococcus phage Syn30]AYR01834.1 virulence associated protein [Synechococcus phage S-P4]AYR01993.1 virulence associated protein [Synechococcus phage S-E7]|tara:strand:- start:756 stop:974 length:219 start_codon:yes stop_codon:yes gene_type:complete
MTVEKVSQEEMLSNFQTRIKTLSEENQTYVAKVRENEQTILKLQGAIETLQYYINGGEEETASHPPDEETQE